MFIDTHCHLYDEGLIENIDQIIENAIGAGVEKMIVAGCDIPSSLQCVELAKKYPQIYACVGFYPEYADKYNEDAEKALKEMAKCEKVVGIGEIGLDYSYQVPKEVQIDVLTKQIKLAHELKLPVVLHGRDVYGQLFDILKLNKEFISHGGTFHCYTGSAELAREINKLGFFVSIGGVSTFQNAVKVRQMASEIDLNKVILETDSPYLAPIPMRGKINQPAYIPYIAKNLAELQHVSLEEIEKITTKNAKGLFNI